MPTMSDIMLVCGMLACYLQACVSYADNHQDVDKLDVFLTLWRIRFLKTFLAIIGALLGFATLPLLQPFYPDFYNDTQLAALDALLSFAAGYAGALTIDKLVSKLHNYIDKI